LTRNLRARELRIERDSLAKVRTRWYHG